MADIKRYEGNIDHLFEHEQGDWVKHSDHEAAIKAAVAAEREACVKIAFERRGAVAYEIGVAIRARGAAHE